MNEEKRRDIIIDTFWNISDMVAMGYCVRIQETYDRKSVLCYLTDDHGMPLLASEEGKDIHDAVYLVRERVEEFKTCLDGFV